MDAIRAQGMVYLHSTPAALLPHVEWALGRLLGGPLTLQWTPQPLKPTQFRTETFWCADPSFGALLTSELLGWGSICFEIVQDEAGGQPGWRWAYTPSLGLFQSQIDSMGNVLVNEHRLMAIADNPSSSVGDLATQLRFAIGMPWERELEPLRMASEDRAVVWLRTATN